MDEVFHEVFSAKATKRIFTTPEGEKYTMLTFVCPGYLEDADD
jgi:hypothetical protein